MKHAYVRSIAMGMAGVFFSLLVTCGDSRAQDFGQYGMRQSQEAQDFKARQQKKMQEYLAQFEKENKNFLSTLYGMDKDEKIIAVQEFISGQYEKNSAFRKKMYEQQRAFMLQRLNANPNAQSYMKERMLSRIDKDYQELMAFHAEKAREDREFLSGLLEDESVDGEELNSRLQSFFQSQKADAKEFLEGQQKKYRGAQPSSAESHPQYPEKSL